MMQSPSLNNKKNYLSPEVTVYKYELANTLLVASNEGLDYEDFYFTTELFNEEPFRLFP